MSASYKVRYHLECCKQSNGEDIKFFTSRDAVCSFELRLAVFRNDCRMSRLPCDKWDHPPTGFAPSSSSFRFGLRRRYTDGAFHGVYLIPSSRHQSPAASCVSKLPSFDPFTSLAFRTLSTFFATCDLVSLFQPTATSRVHLQGFLPSTQPTQLVAARLPSRRFADVAYKQLPIYASCTGAALKALLRVEIRTVSLRLFTATKGRSPLGFSSSRFSPEATFPVPSHFLPPYTFVRVCRCHSRTWSLATVAPIGLPFPRLPTCSRFGTCPHSPLTKVM